MDLVILEKIKASILNGLGYIVRLEKKNGNKFAAKIVSFTCTNDLVVDEYVYYASRLNILHFMK